MTDKLDLPLRYREQLEALLRNYVPEAEVWAYGSRIRNRSHAGSDLDLVLRGPGLERLGDGYYDLLDAIEQSNIPILIQVHDWARLPESFHREIERNYVVVQEQAKQTPSEEWREVFVSEVASARIGGTPSRAVAEYWQGNVPWATAKDIANSGPRYLDKVEESISKIGLAESAAKLMPEGTVIITARGTVGALAQLRREMAFNQTCYALVPTDEIDNDFLFYALKGTLTTMETLTYDTVFQTITRKSFNEWRLPLPLLPEQRAIVHVLGTLDDKIELNRQMNETLETMARTLFKSWFVDFDPVRAKMEGRNTGLPKDIADFFPDRMVDSELGEIPEGWEVGVLDDVVELFSGGTPKTSVIEYWDGNIPWYTAKDAPPLSDVFVLETERNITQKGIENSAAKILPARTTIITARGTVGRLACLGIPMAMNQTCYGIRGTKGYPDFFIYWLIRKTVRELQNRTHGTIFDTITRQTFKIVNTVLPSVSLAERFEEAISPIIENVLNNLHESHTLTTLRDTLLPKLISGEIRVSEAEQSVEAVT